MHRAEAGWAEEAIFLDPLFTSRASRGPLPVTRNSLTDKQLATGIGASQPFPKQSKIRFPPIRKFRIIDSKAQFMAIQASKTMDSNRNSGGFLVDCLCTEPGTTFACSVHNI
jgi:hypothetical protein